MMKTSILLLVNFLAAVYARSPRCSSYQDPCRNPADCCPGKGLTCNSTSSQCYCESGSERIDLYDKCGLSQRNIYINLTPEKTSELGQTIGAIILGTIVGVCVLIGLIIWCCRGRCKSVNGNARMMATPSAPDFIIDSSPGGDCGGGCGD